MRRRDEYDRESNLAGKGRDENPDAAQDWVRYHDQYKGASKDGCA